jgi:hypothetical protein
LTYPVDFKNKQKGTLPVGGVPFLFCVVIAKEVDFLMANTNNFQKR